MKFINIRTFRNIRTILLDLLIVFIGVFMAFQLSAYREEESEKKLRLNFYKSFEAELKTVNKELTDLIKELDYNIQKFDSGALINEKPVLGYNQKINFFYQKPYIVESAFNSGNFRTLHYDLLSNISGGSNLFYMLNNKIVNYNKRVKDLTYSEPFDEQKFYTTFALKNEYAWYLNEMKEIRFYAIQLKSSIERGALPAMETLINEK